MVNADLRDAELYRARLHGANLTGAQLAGANLKYALYDHSTVWPDGFVARWSGAVLQADGEAR